MKKKLAPLLALILVCMQCNDKPQPPANPGKGLSVTIGGKTIEVVALTTFDQRREPNYNIAKGTGLVIAHARERILHLYNLASSPRTLNVAFLNSQGAVVDTQPLHAGEQGVTSAVEAKFAVVTHTDISATKGDTVSFSEELKKLPAAENPMIRINGVPVYVEISNSYDRRQRGLMNRPKMSANDGMLFTYPSSDTRKFWMGHCYLKLSLAYIRSDLVISQFHDMDPYPDPENPGSNYQSWPSKEEVQYVLEVNQGFFKKHDLKEGMKVEFPPELKDYKPE